MGGSGPAVGSSLCYQNQRKLFGGMQKLFHPESCSGTWIRRIGSQYNYANRFARYLHSPGLKNRQYPKIDPKWADSCEKGDVKVEDGPILTQDLSAARPRSVRRFVWCVNSFKIVLAQLTLGVPCRNSACKIFNDHLLLEKSTQIATLAKIRPDRRTLSTNVHQIVNNLPRYTSHEFSTPNSPTIHP